MPLYAPQVRITGLLKSRINRLAHARAQRFELDEIARISAELARLAAEGKNVDSLHSYLDAAEK